jgi:hypothetical protein
MNARALIGRVINGLVDAFSGVFERTLPFTPSEDQGKRSKKSDYEGKDFDCFHFC